MGNAMKKIPSIRNAMTPSLEKASIEKERVMAEQIYSQVSPG